MAQAGPDRESAAEECVEGLLRLRPSRRHAWIGWWRWLLTALLPWAVWVYLAVVIAVWLLIALTGDRWWFGTVVLFGPRTGYALPLAVLLPWAAVSRRTLLRPLAAAALVVIWPIMGLSVPWARLAPRNGATIRVLTCNIDVGGYDERALARLIAEIQPDVVALEECPAEVRLAWPAGWHVYRNGEFLVASRYVMADWQIARCSPLACSWKRMHAVACIVKAEAGDVRFCCLHLQTPREGLHDVLSRRILINPTRSAELVTKIEQRRQESQELADWVAQFHEPLIIAGDFNLPTDSGIYRQYWDKYTNAFSATGSGFGYTKLTPVKRLRYGLRIDHVLSSSECRPARCWVGPDVGSDHLPLFADLHLPSASRTSD